MNLTRTQFDVLAFLEREKDEKNMTQRGIARLTGLSLGTVNKTMLFLIENGLVENNSLNAAGLQALEPYHVKRAVFIAAGFGLIWLK